ncbi:MAG: hypothetical protein K6C94_06470, partial [Candidatus Gastranaerophilales bacterium]|nr:hypothetical protein [Candidatus Gastranaerophilales bacterium]
EGAVKAIEDIDKLLTVLNNKQSEIGAVFNRLESVAMSNTMGVENMSAGLSTIVDADIAKLNSEYVKNQILQNASSALMVQASNLNREVVLGLLRNL